MSIYGPYSSVESTPSLSAAVPVIDEGGGEYAPRLVWGSDDGTETHSSWEISIGVTGYHRGDANGGAAFAVDGSATKTVGSSCYSHKDSHGRHVWACPLTDLIPDYLSDPATYENRECDALILTATLTELATGARYTKTGTVKLNYRPLYTLEAFYYISNATAVIEYSTTWTRTDDRCHLWAGRSTVAVSPYSTAALGSTEQYVSVASFDASSGTGVVALDATKFDRVAIGAECKLQLSFIQSISVSQRTVTQTLLCEDGATCDAPKLYVSVDGLTAVVRAEPDGSTGHKYETATIALVGGTLHGDTVALDYAAGETEARFPYVPLGTEVTFQAFGSRDPGDGGAEIVSAVTEYSLTVDSGGQCELKGVEGGGAALLEYHASGSGPGPDVSLSPGMDTVQLAGRSRPSAYPTGSSEVGVDVSGIVFGDGDGGWRDVAEGGLCVLRTPGGGRWPVVVDSVKTEYIDEGDYTEVSVSCEEVDWQ